LTSSPQPVGPIDTAEIRVTKRESTSMLDLRWALGLQAPKRRDLAGGTREPETSASSFLRRLDAIKITSTFSSHTTVLSLDHSYRKRWVRTASPR
jgi:hypothetical protein